MADPGSGLFRSRIRRPRGEGGERHEVELVTPFGADEEERNAALDQCDFDGSMKRLAEGLDDDLEGACHE